MPFELHDNHPLVAIAASALKSLGGYMIGLIVMGFVVFYVVLPAASFAERRGHATRRVALLFGVGVGALLSALSYLGNVGKGTPTTLVLEAVGCEYEFTWAGSYYTGAVEEACARAQDVGQFTFNTVPGALTGVLMALIFWRAYSGRWRA